MPSPTHPHPPAIAVSPFVRALPKVELHAHLNGSIDRRTYDALRALHLRRFPDEKLQGGKRFRMRI